MEFKLSTAVWELTNACNANCIHCGSKSGAQRRNELTLKEALRVCDDLKELGCQRLSLIGGEIFLNPYWEAVCARLVQHGIKVAPLTNGLLINQTNLAKLKRAGIDNVAFSIDGLAKIHDYIRGVPGLFNQVIENIKLAQQAGFLVGVNTAISALNLGELPKLYEFLLKSGIKLWQFQIVEDMGKASENPELRLSVDDLYKVALEIANYRQRKEMTIVITHNIGWFCSFEPLLRDQPFTGCLAGRTIVGINSNGDIRGCLSLMSGDSTDNVEGNIRQRSLVEIWNDPQSFAPFRQRTVEGLTGYCAQCEYQNLCRGGCSSVAFSLTRKFSENPYCLHQYEVNQGIEYNNCS